MVAWRRPRSTPHPTSPHAPSPLHDTPPAAVLAAGQSARVVILSREHCTLCAEALRVASDLGIEVSVLDVDTDPELHRRYTDHVPVTVVDGRVLSLWFLDPAALTAALDAGPADQPPE